MSFKPLPPATELSRIYHYDPETGAFYWRKARPGRSGGKGAPAGFRRRGRAILRVNNEEFYAYRIAYALMTGEDPGKKDIDHVNGDCSDDRWANLRCVSRGQNLYNRQGYSHPGRKGTGFKGVYKRGEKYFGSVFFKGKTVYLGTFSTPEEGAVAVAEFYADKGVLQFQPKSVQTLALEAK
jgi:hypothetical protein